MPKQTKTVKKPQSSTSVKKRPASKATPKKSAVKAHHHTLICKPRTVNGKTVYDCKPYKAQAAASRARTTAVAASRSNDGPFLFKLSLLALIGLLWVKLSFASGLQLPLPVGFVLGMIVAVRERRTTDRKILFVVLLAALLVGFIAPFGLYIVL